VKNIRSQPVRNRTHGPNRPEKPDRRVQKTKASLRDALVRLAREKPYGSIAVKDILDRANVGRSTFYTHFRDKDELLENGIHEMLCSMHDRPSPGSAIDQVIAFSLPILEYVAAHRHTDGPTMARESRVVMHDHLRDVLAKLVAEKISTMMRHDRASMPGPLIARYIASTFVLVLDWWVDSGAASTPGEVDACFRALVLPTLTTL
jgi:AcrR family transcriptional regulator